MVVVYRERVFFFRNYFPPPPRSQNSLGTVSQSLSGNAHLHVGQLEWEESHRRRQQSQ